MPLHIGDGKRTAEGFDASSRTDRPRARARGVVRPSQLLGVSNELSAIEVHLDHVLYVHPSIAVSFRIVVRSGVSRASDRLAPHDVTVSGARFGLVSDDAFADLQLIRGSVLAPCGPSGDSGPVGRAVG